MRKAHTSTVDAELTTAAALRDTLCATLAADPHDGEAFRELLAVTDHLALLRFERDEILRATNLKYAQLEVL